MALALVTGASSGIGEALARTIADDGHDLVLVARRADRLDALATALRAKGRQVEVLTADLLDPAGLHAVIARLTDAGDPVDELVNNAGVALYGAFTGCDPADAVRQLDLHAHVPMRLMLAALPGMVARRRGGVLNVASTAGLQGTPGLAAYSASKAALVALSEAVHYEVRGHGVRVTCTAPGYTRTELQAAARVDASCLPRSAWMDADTVAGAAWAAHQRGRALTVPGLVNRNTARIMRLLPRRAGRAAGAAVVRRVVPQGVG